MEFHDDYPQYEFMSQHSEEDGKKSRRKLWNVFWIMLGITIVELIVGAMAPARGWSGTLWLKVFFIGFTIIKAGYIVMAFMHLGHEVKFFKYVVLLPYTVFILYAIFIIINEGTYSSSPLNKTKEDPIFLKQQQELLHHDREAKGLDSTGKKKKDGESHNESESHH